MNYDYFGSTGGSNDDKKNKWPTQQQQQPQQPQTFKQMQQSGIARPAPQYPAPMQTRDASQYPTPPNMDPGRVPQFPPAQMPPQMPPPQMPPQGPQVPGPASGVEGQLHNTWQGYNNLSPMIAQQLGYAVSSPSRYDSDVVMDSYNRLDRRMGDQFDLDRQHINEDAARRGVYYGTIPVGRMGDVSVRQSQARSDLASSLLQDQARTYQSDRLAGLGAAAGYGSQSLNDYMRYGQQSFDNQLSTAQFNQQQDAMNTQLLMQLLGYT